MSGIKHRWKTIRTRRDGNHRVAQQRCEVCGLFRWWRGRPDSGEESVFLHRDDIRWQTIDDDDVLELTYRPGTLVHVSAPGVERDQRISEMLPCPWLECPRCAWSTHEDGGRPAATLGEGATCPHCGMSPALRRFPAPRRAR